jgi:hypothetical protein
MRVGLIPQFYQQSIAEKIDKVINTFGAMFSEDELKNIKRVSNLLSDPPIEDKNKDALTDLKNFITQYDQRRKKNYKESLDKGFIEWYDTI